MEVEDEAFFVVEDGNPFAVKAETVFAVANDIFPVVEDEDAFAWNCFAVEDDAVVVKLVVEAMVVKFMVEDDRTAVELVVAEDASKTTAMARPPTNTQAARAITTTVRQECWHLLWVCKTSRSMVTVAWTVASLNWLTGLFFFSC